MKKKLKFYSNSKNMQKKVGNNISKKDVKKQRCKNKKMQK